jgi:hypothetical protein
VVQSYGVVGERRVAGEAAEESSRGRHTSENAGMSSERRVRNPSSERPRVPGPGSSALGKSGPKARPTGVVDGQRVDIPVPANNRQSLSSGAKSPNPDHRVVLRGGAGTGLTLDPMLVRLA